MNTVLDLYSRSIGASHKIVALDRKKRADSEKVGFDFRTKKISAYGVEDEILDEIHKFPFPMQKMLVKEAGEGQVCTGTTHSIVTVCSALDICYRANISFTNIYMVPPGY